MSKKVFWSVIFSIIGVVALVILIVNIPYFPYCDCLKSIFYWFPAGESIRKSDLVSILLTTLSLIFDVLLVVVIYIFDREKNKEEKSVQAMQWASALQFNNIKFFEIYDTNFNYTKILDRLYSKDSFKENIALRVELKSSVIFPINYDFKISELKIANTKLYKKSEETANASFNNVVLLEYDNKTPNNDCDSLYNLYTFDNKTILEFFLPYTENNYLHNDCLYNFSTVVAKPIDIFTIQIFMTIQDNKQYYFKNPEKYILTLIGRKEKNGYSIIKTNFVADGGDTK